MNPLDWIYPPKCMACNRLIPVNDKDRRALWLCDDCELLCEVVEPPICEICGTSVPEDIRRCGYCVNKNHNFTRNYAGFRYDGILVDILHEIKFRNKKHCAGGLGTLWARALTELPVEADYLVPVPMHRKKQRLRGFNQALILADSLSRRFNIPLIPALIRTQNTPPQSGFSMSHRAENVRGVFSLNPKYENVIADKILILVDDIFTTGASLSECAGVLKQHGAAEVVGMTLCVAVKTSP